MNDMKLRCSSVYGSMCRDDNAIRLHDIGVEIHDLNIGINSLIRTMEELGDRLESIAKRVERDEHDLARIRSEIEEVLDNAE